MCEQLLLWHLPSPHFREIKTNLKLFSAKKKKTVSVDRHGDPVDARYFNNDAVNEDGIGREEEDDSNAGDHDDGDQEEDEDVSVTGSTCEEEEDEEEDEKEASPPPKRWSASQKGKKVGSAVSGVTRGGVVKRSAAAAKYGGKNALAEKKRKTANKDVEVTYDEIPGDHVEEDLSQPQMIVSRTKYLLGDRLYLQARKVHVNLKKKENSYSFEALTFCREPHQLQGEEGREAFHYNFPAKYGYALYRALRKIYGRAIIEAFKDTVGAKEAAGKGGRGNAADMIID